MRTCIHSTHYWHTSRFRSELGVDLNVLKVRALRGKYEFLALWILLAPRPTSGAARGIFGTDQARNHGIGRKPSRSSQRHPFPCSYDTDTCCIMLCFSWTSSLRTRRGQRVEGRDHGTRLSVFRRFLWLKHQSFGPIPAKLPAFTITPNLNQSSQSGFAKQPLLHVPRYIQPGTAGWRHKDRDKPRPGTERKGFLPCDHPGASGVFGLPEPTSSSRV